MLTLLGKKYDIEDYWNMTRKKAEMDLKQSEFKILAEFLKSIEGDNE